MSKEKSPEYYDIYNFVKKEQFEDKELFIPLYDNLGGVHLLDVSPRVVPKGRTCDVAISQAARVSYGHDMKSKKADENLVRYLVENWHTSPLEMISFKFKLRMPIFVANQLVRHRTAKLNCYSMRYSEAPDEFYKPEIRMQSKINKQSSVDVEKVDSEVKKVWDDYFENSKKQYERYQFLIKNGVAREVARCGLSVNIMTEMIWTMDLHNLLKFLKLRMDSHAQKEIQVLANAIYELINHFAPVACKAAKDFWFDSISFSKKEQEFIPKVLNGGNPQFKSKRKNKVFKDKLEKIKLSSNNTCGSIMLNSDGKYTITESSVSFSAYTGNSLSISSTSDGPYYLEFNGKKVNPENGYTYVTIDGKLYKYKDDNPHNKEEVKL